jgi:hypothetical protein
MTRRRAWLLGGTGMLILLLFAGRATAELVAARWWAAQFSPGAARAVFRWHLWQLGLGTAAVGFAVTWFVLQMLIVIRAVGSVQILRDVGGLQFREVVRPGALKAFALGAGACLGLVTGLGIGDEWQVVLLALHGVTFGLADPLLGRDAGWYVARLPLQELAQQFALALPVLAALASLMLYAIMGAVRVERRRPAINDHARRHLGLLLALIALVIAWGFLLRNAHHVSTMRPPLAGAVASEPSVGAALAGTALMVAALSALWAWRGRHVLLLAGWAVLGVAALVARTGVPILAPSATPVADSTLRTFEDTAFGLGSGSVPEALAAAPLFDRGTVSGLVGTDALVRLTAAASMPVADTMRPAWLALVEPTDGPAVGIAIAADTAGSGGAALSYRLRDSLAYPTLYPAVTFGPAAARPGATDVAEVPAGRGVATGSPLRRLLVAWAAQSRLPFAVRRVDWALHPVARLEQLAPFAAWSGLRMAVRDDRVVWLADGYVSSRYFPLTAAERWRGGSARLLRAGFLGVVDAETGAVQVYLRPDGGALAVAWADLGHDIVLPSNRLDPRDLARAGPPDALAAVQASLLAQRLAAASGESPVLVEQGSAGQASQGWTRRGDPVLIYLLALPDADRLFAVLQMRGGVPPAVALLSGHELNTPASLERLWGRFVTFDPIEDSIVGAGAHVTSGHVHLWSSPQGLAAFETLTAGRPGARPALVWVSVGLPDRLGAGRSLELAWDNLQGNSSPAPPGQGAGTINDARRWMRIADDALRSGDWEAFGRAFEALRRVLQGSE